MAGACMVGACVAGGMSGRGGHAWQGVCGGGMCVIAKTAIAAGSTHPTGMHSCLFHLVMWIQQS